MERFSKTIEFDEQKATYYALALYHLGDLKGSLAEYNCAIVLNAVHDRADDDTELVHQRPLQRGNRGHQLQSQVLSPLHIIQQLNA
jgi:hypothetical protein